MEIDKLTEKIIGCAIEVHKELGLGLLESTYEQCLAREFALNKINFEIHKSLPILYKGIKLDCGKKSQVGINRMNQIFFLNPTSIKPKPV